MKKNKQESSVLCGTFFFSAKVDENFLEKFSFKLFPFSKKYVMIKNSIKERAEFWRNFPMNNLRPY